MRFIPRPINVVPGISLAWLPSLTNVPLVCHLCAPVPAGAQHETAERLEVLRRADRYEQALSVKDQMLWVAMQARDLKPQNPFANYRVDGDCVEPGFNDDMLRSVGDTVELCVYAVAQGRARCMD